MSRQVDPGDHASSWFKHRQIMFVADWQRAESLEDIAHQQGLSLHTALRYAKELRQLGYELRKLEGE